MVFVVACVPFAICCGVSCVPWASRSFFLFVNLVTVLPFAARHLPALLPFQSTYTLIDWVVEFLLAPLLHRSAQPAPEQVPPAIHLNILFPHFTRVVWTFFPNSGPFPWPWANFQKRALTHTHTHIYRKTCGKPQHIPIILFLFFFLLSGAASGISRVWPALHIETKTKTPSCFAFIASTVGCGYGGSSSSTSSSTAPIATKLTSNNGKQSPCPCFAVARIGDG